MKLNQNINKGVVNATDLPSLALSKQSLGLLQALLEQNINNFIPSGRHFVIYKGKNKDIILTHSLLRRPRARDISQYRIEVLGPSLAEGGFGNIYTSMGVLEPENKFNFKRKPYGKERVVKEINLQHQSIKSICKEAAFTRYNEQLHCKSAIFSTDDGYLVMRRAVGEDLLSIINNIYNKKIDLGAKLYLLLTLALLKAVKTQVHDKQLIHRDIKPENIIVDLQTMHVAMIDYAFAREITKKNRPKHIRGTYMFMAPETLLENRVTQSSDIYSLGLVLAELWGDTSLDDIDDPDDRDAILEYRKHYVFRSLFNNIAITKTLREGIKSLISGLTCYKESERMGLDEAILQCTHLLDQLSTDHSDGQNAYFSFFRRSHSDGSLPAEGHFYDQKAGC